MYIDLIGFISILFHHF